MTYVVIDGDDVGRKMASFYFTNDTEGLRRLASKVQEKILQVAHLLRSAGYNVIFCAADGVAAQAEIPISDSTDLFPAIEAIGGGDMTFSAGVGVTLREAYVALLSAKSAGKAQLCVYGDLP